MKLTYWKCPVCYRSYGHKQKCEYAGATMRHPWGASGDYYHEEKELREITLENDVTQVEAGWDTYDFFYVDCTIVGDHPHAFTWEGQKILRINCADQDNADELVGQINE